MDLMFELTRRCDMQCSHCLRGDAQGKDMSENTMLSALHMFKDIASQITMGGGETTLKPKLLNTFVQQLHWSRINSKYMEPTWFVTNGKRLLKQRDIYLEYDPYGDEEEVHNTELVEALVKFSNYIPINLAVSTDSWHDHDAEARHRHVEDIFELHENITVFAHGPRNYSNLLSMGRNGGSGTEVAIESDSAIIYITVNGDIYTDCNLSYYFMDTFKDSLLCLGNVHTSTIEEVTAAKDLLDAIIEAEGDSSISVGFRDITEFEKRVELYNKINKEVICEIKQ